MVLCRISVICYDGAVNQTRTEREEGSGSRVLREALSMCCENSAYVCAVCDQSDRRMTHHQDTTGSGHIYREMMTSLPLER